MDPAAWHSLQSRRERRAWHHESPGRVGAAHGRPCGAVSGALRARRTARRHALAGLVIGRVPPRELFVLACKGLSLHVKALVLACKFQNTTTLIADCDS